jgi:ATP-dependent Lon protease
MIVNLDVGRPRSVNAVGAAMGTGKRIFLATQKTPQVSDPTLKELYPAGVVAEIKQLLKLPGGTLRILIEGLERAEISKLNVVKNAEEYWEGELELIPTLLPEEDREQVEALRRLLIEVFEKWGHDR